MKVNVVQRNKTMVALYSLEPGDGFLFDGFPHIVGNPMVGHVSGSVAAFNLRNYKIVAIPKHQQVQLTQINVEYTV